MRDKLLMHALQLQIRLWKQRIERIRKSDESRRDANYADNTYYGCVKEIEDILEAAGLESE